MGEADFIVSFLLSSITHGEGEEKSGNPFRRLLIASRKKCFRLEKSCGINKNGVQEKSLSYIFFFEVNEKSQFVRIHPSMDYRKSGWKAFVQVAEATSTAQN